MTNKYTKRGAVPIHILSFAREIENEKKYEIHINFHEGADGFSSSHRVFRGRRSYAVEYIRKHIVFCPEYAAAGEIVVIIPYFLIPGRKYAAQVYIFAIILYSTRPELGQRGVAAATRKKFGLPQFSHSTVCRVFKAFEASVAKAAAKTIGGRAPDSGERAGAAGRFPSVSDTSARRGAMAEFLRRVLGADPRAAMDRDVNEVSRDVVKYWYGKYKRLII